MIFETILPWRIFILFQVIPFLFCFIWFNDDPLILWQPSNTRFFNDQPRSALRTMYNIFHILFFLCKYDRINLIFRIWFSKYFSWWHFIGNPWGYSLMTHSYPCLIKYYHFKIYFYLQKICRELSDWINRNFSWNNED